MVEQRRIKVEVAPGMFPSERAVMFRANNRNYNLIVDQSDVIENNMINVWVLGERDGQVLVELPRETFTTGNQVVIPRDCLL